MDATIIHAPLTTKNKSGVDGREARDSEMSSTKKGSQWTFVMKLHVGSDAEFGLVHTVRFTTASVHDSHIKDQLVHGKEKLIYGDKAYANGAWQMLT